MRESHSHVEEKKERSTKEKNLEASIAFLDKSLKYTSGIATTSILLVCKQKQ